MSELVNALPKLKAKLVELEAQNPSIMDFIDRSISEVDDARYKAASSACDEAWESLRVKRDALRAAIAEAEKQLQIQIAMELIGDI